MKKKNIVIIIICSFFSLVALVVAIPFGILSIRTANLRNEYSYLTEDPNYSLKAEVNGVDLVTQHVSCGYATIQMLSTYYGAPVTEDELDARNRSVSTASSSGFLKEVNRSIPSKSFVMHDYLKYDQMLKEIHSSLKNGNPVAIEWAAKDTSNVWTLHFSVVTAIDLTNNLVRVNNPYGYIENITVSDFLNRTSFEAYKSMPVFLGFGFAFGAFHKNTIFFAI